MVVVRRFFVVLCLLAALVCSSLRRSAGLCLIASCAPYRECSGCVIRRRAPTRVATLCEASTGSIRNDRCESPAVQESQKDGSR